MEFLERIFHLLIKLKKETQKEGVIFTHQDLQRELEKLGTEFANEIKKLQDELDQIASGPEKWKKEPKEAKLEDLLKAQTLLKDQIQKHFVNHNPEENDSKSTSRLIDVLDHKIRSKLFSDAADLVKEIWTIEEKSLSPSEQEKKAIDTITLGNPLDLANITDALLIPNFINRILEKIDSDSVEGDKIITNLKRLYLIAQSEIDDQHHFLESIGQLFVPDKILQANLKDLRNYFFPGMIDQEIKDAILDNIEHSYINEALELNETELGIKELLKNYFNQTLDLDSFTEATETQYGLTFTEDELQDTLNLFEVCEQNGSSSLNKDDREQTGAVHKDYADIINSLFEGILDSGDPDERLAMEKGELLGKIDASYTVMGLFLEYTPKEQDIKNRLEQVFREEISFARFKEIAEKQYNMTFEKEDFAETFELWAKMHRQPKSQPPTETQEIETKLDVPLSLSPETLLQSVHQVLTQEGWKLDKEKTFTRTFQFLDTPNQDFLQQLSTLRIVGGFGPNHPQGEFRTDLKITKKEGVFEKEPLWTKSMPTLAEIVAHFQLKAPLDNIAPVAFAHTKHTQLHIIQGDTVLALSYDAFTPENGEPFAELEVELKKGSVDVLKQLTSIIQKELNLMGSTYPNKYVRVIDGITKKNKNLKSSEDGGSNTEGALQIKDGEKTRSLLAPPPQRDTPDKNQPLDQRQFIVLMPWEITPISPVINSSYMPLDLNNGQLYSHKIMPTQQKVLSRLQVLNRAEIYSLRQVVGMELYSYEAPITIETNIYNDMRSTFHVVPRHDKLSTRPTITIEPVYKWGSRVSPSFSANYRLPRTIHPATMIQGSNLVFPGWVLVNYGSAKIAQMLEDSNLKDLLPHTYDLAQNTHILSNTPVVVLDDAYKEWRDIEQNLGYSLHQFQDNFFSKPKAVHSAPSSLTSEEIRNQLSILGILTSPPPKRMQEQQVQASSLGFSKGRKADLHGNQNCYPKASEPFTSGK